MCSFPRSLATLFVAATITAVVGCGVSPAAAARHKPAQREAPTPEQATATCRASVRARNPNFDIYHTDQPTPHFETFGTDSDRFAFRKCMSGYGYEIPGTDSVSPTTPPAPTYSESDVRAAFMTGCLKLGSREVCDCSWSRLRKQYTVAQLMQMATANVSGAFEAAGTACTAEIANSF